MSQEKSGKGYDFDYFADKKTLNDSSTVSFTARELQLVRKAYSPGKILLFIVSWATYTTLD